MGRLVLHTGNTLSLEGEVGEQWVPSLEGKESKNYSVAAKTSLIPGTLCTSVRCGTCAKCTEMGLSATLPMIKELWYAVQGLAFNPAGAGQPAGL